MSVASDKFEKDIAEAINGTVRFKAERPTADTGLSDVLIQDTTNSKRAWLEVKMNHTDNLSNPRFYYENGLWKTTYKTPVAQEAVKILNSKPFTKEFIKKIATFSGIPENVIKIPTSRAGLREPGAVPLHVMKLYFAQPGVNRYIVAVQNVDIGALVTRHYTEGKKEPAYYMQASDDFYLISPKNPLKLAGNIPLLKGIGDFKVRISTRSEFYEVQAEVKIKDMGSSRYSCMAGSKKINPFL